jgi:hypothetical protein
VVTPTGAQRVLTVTVSVPLEPEAARELCAWLSDQLASGEVVGVRCEITGLRADLAALDTVARLALATRRFGRALMVEGASRDLRDLAVFTGLSHVLGLDG